MTERASKNADGVESAAERAKQIHYRDARVNGDYDGIWQNVGKCVFCDLRDKYVVYEENGVALTVPLYAYIDGQLLIVPRRHIRSVKEMTGAEWNTVRKLIYLAKKMIRDVHHIKGMQLVQKTGASAQSTVEHLHFHCIPFDAPDLCQWNYRRLKNTPLENAELYRAGSAKIQKLSKRFEEKYD
ncbi:MAG: HIT family protein [Candidatus Nomurabacteria bacterium]|jgi:diadenosine tetraphosphate (Ap4A) HIT family hydrolase|nr:HIT family protein [Candidatus Nomurabacteria bacterium]